MYADFGFNIRVLTSARDKCFVESISHFGSTMSTGLQLRYTCRTHLVGDVFRPLPCTSDRFIACRWPLASKRSQLNLIAAATDGSSWLAGYDEKKLLLMQSKRGRHRLWGRCVGWAGLGIATQSFGWVSHNPIGSTNN